MEIRMTLDQEVLDRYNQYYFARYPKRKKIPIPRPLHESINVWGPMNTLARNNIKKHWDEFIAWWMDELKLKDKRLETFEAEFIYYMPTKRRADCDNLTPKFILDGLVHAGVIVDDDYLHLTKLTIRAGYDKCRPRTEIILKTTDAAPEI